MAYVDENSVTTLTNEIKAFVQASFLDMLYPVGSVYLSVESTSPAVLFGGSWEQIKDTFLLSAGDNYSAGASGGKAIYSANDMPAHTHTRGTMEIVGQWSTRWNQAVRGFFELSTSGAFYFDQDNSKPGRITAEDGSASNSGKTAYPGFRASGGWTGETSQSGANTYATILPPYLVVYMWKRTA